MRRSLRCGLAMLLGLTAGATDAANSASAAELSGRVELLAKGRTGRDRSADLRQVLIYFEPAHSSAPLPAPVQVDMVTRKKEFLPHLLIVPVGSTVRFPNEDPILHNVFSVSGENRFDLGLYSRGPGKAVKFDEAGLVRVFCNVHHSMVSYIMVLTTPHYSLVDGEGRFALKGVPPGPGRLVAWHERSDPTAMEITVPPAQPLLLQLEIVKPRIPPHSNKLGKPYQARSGGDYE